MGSKSSKSELSNSQAQQQQANTQITNSQQQQIQQNISPQNLSSYFNYQNQNVEEHKDSNQYNDDEPLKERKEYVKSQKQQNYDLSKNLEINIKSLTKAVKLDSKKSQILPCMIQLQTKEEKQGQNENELQNRPGIDLICVIDTSGSMGGNKISLVQNTLEQLVDNLGENDRISLIQFSSSSKRLCPLIKVNKENKIKLQQYIKDLRSGGGTQILSGMTKAFDCIKYRKQQNDVTSIFLLSDGQDGGSGKIGVEQSLKSYNFQDSFTINTFGFGSDHDENLMSGISMLRDGSFYYVEKLDMVDECFCDALGGLFSVIGENVQIQLQVQNDHEYMKNAKICKTFGGIWKQNKDGYAIELKQIISGFSKEFVFEIEIPAVKHNLSDNNRNVELLKASVKVSTVCDKKQQIEKNNNMVLTLFNENEQIPEDSEQDDVQINYLRVKGAEVLVDCMNQAEKGQYEMGQKMVQEVIDQLDRQKSCNQTKLAHLKVDLSNAKSQCKPRVYEDYGCKMMMNVQQCHYQQKSNMNNIDMNMYQNTKMKSMQKACKAKKGLF